MPSNLRVPGKVIDPAKWQFYTCAKLNSLIAIHRAETLNERYEAASFPLQ
jgi:hypothetical protein